LERVRLTLVTYQVPLSVASLLLLSTKGGTLAANEIFQKYSGVDRGVGPHVAKRISNATFIPDIFTTMLAINVCRDTVR